MEIRLVERMMNVGDSKNSENEKVKKAKSHEKVGDRNSDDYLHIMWEQDNSCQIKGSILFLLSLLLFCVLLLFYYLPKYADIGFFSTSWNVFSLADYYDDSMVTLLFWGAGFLSLILMITGIKIFNKGNK